MNDDDADTASEDAPDSELPISERKLVTQSYDLSVGTLIEQWNDKTLILPEIQREYVWSDGRASRLIESLLLNVPIPVLYFAEAPGDHYEVIDGHQRVRSIVRYVNNEFRLSGLRVMSDSEHRGKRYHQLSAGDQRRIKTRVMRAIIITDESHPSMKFEVFERLNSGSIALNAMEIRNSTHRGPFMNLAKENWVLNDDFRASINTKKPRARMVDVELVIRFLALREGLKTYRPPLPRFLNNYCALMNQESETSLTHLGDIFANAARNVRALYGQNAFRLTDADGRLLDRNFNRGLAEAQLRTLSYAETSQVTKMRRPLLQELAATHSDPAFLDNIQRAIVDRSRTVGRMQHYKAACERAGVPIPDGT